MSSGYSVLIVDDNADLRLDLSEILALEGYNVFTAGDGKEALEIFKNQKIDIVISDYEMPNMNGYVFLEALRAKQETAQIPFILVTGGLVPIPTNTLNFRFMRKPISIEKLIAVVGELIMHPNGEDQRAAD